MKKGQITVFIIIGILILLVIGIAVYLTKVRVTKEITAVRPSVETIPQEIQPVRDFVEACIKRLGTDGLKRVGDQGGYVEPNLMFNPTSPTEGEAVQFSPGAGPLVAYWWYMKSRNECTKDCIFDSNRPPLYRSQGGNSIEVQLDNYVTNNLRSCLDNFKEFGRKDCTVTEEGEPEVTANVAEEDVFFVGKYPIRVTCGAQTVSLENYYVSIPLNLREIYNLATTLTAYESEYRLLEQATTTVIEGFSGRDSSKLPPPRDMDVGSPSPGTFWIKYEVGKKLQRLLMSYIPLIQTQGVKNYKYIVAPAAIRDTDLYETIYNRQFFIPMNESHPSLETHFMYLDWWQPYFEMNCNGQLCQADSLSSFFLIPIGINRYTFAYDVSYPVLVEVRNPTALGGEGYSFKFFLEENMRNSESFLSEAPPVKGVAGPISSIFCDPSQRTSGKITITARDGLSLKPLEGATVGFICNNQNCNLGETDKGNYSSKFPRCIGGTLRMTKAGYASLSVPLDTHREEPFGISVTMEPIRTVQARVKDFPITKASKHSGWQFIEDAGLMRPREKQTTTITLTKNATPYEEPFAAVVELEDDKPGDLTIVPGKYSVQISSFLKEDLVIPPDQRCFKIRKFLRTSTKCYYVPEKPILFNETSPFPYGSTSYDYEFTADMLRGAKSIEFRQFVLAIDNVPENQRIIEDLSELNKINMYSAANLERLYPVISK